MMSKQYREKECTLVVEKPAAHLLQNLVFSFSQGETLSLLSKLPLSDFACRRCYAAAHSKLVVDLGGHLLPLSFTKLSIPKSSLLIKQKTNKPS